MPSDPASTASVIAFAGHMVDSPRRSSPRFPRQQEEIVAHTVRRMLAQQSAVAGVGSLACGADIIFAESLLERGAELHLVLPLNVEEFLEQSVRFSGDSEWESRFHAIRRQATTEEVYGDDYVLGTGTAFLLAGMLIDGMAQLLACERNLRQCTMCVWDGERGDGLGGTASFVAHAVERNRSTFCIRPLSGEVFSPSEAAISLAQMHSWRRIRSSLIDVEYRMAASLFADALGFGDLKEREIPTFLRIVMTCIAAALGRRDRYLVVNTWGDGLFVLTQTPLDAAALALRLRTEASRVDARREGLRQNISFRIGLHAGPAFYTTDDPITHAPNAFGRDVSLAARIEPLVPPNEVWASSAFVALCVSSCDAWPKFEYVGRRALPKAAGELPLYRLVAWGSGFAS